MNTALKATPHNAAAIVREMHKRGRGAKREMGVTKKQQRLKNRFGTDERTYCEKNKHWRDLAEFMSYLGQFISVSGAGYSVGKFIYEPTVGGILSVFLFALLLIGFEALQRWTSDEHWDKWAEGNFSFGSAFLNFGVILPLSILLTLGGIFFFSKDTQEDPQMYADPEVASIRAEIAALRAENEDYKTNDQYKVSSGKDAGEIRWNVSQMIASNTEQIATLTSSLQERFGVTAAIDKAAFEYHQLASETRTWFMLGMSLLALLVFEISMWYRSKYDHIKYAEDVLSGTIQDPGYYALLQGKPSKPGK